MQAYRGEPLPANVSELNRMQLQIVKRRKRAQTTPSGRGPLFEPPPMCRISAKESQDMYYRVSEKLRVEERN